MDGRDPGHGSAASDSASTSPVASPAAITPATAGSETASPPLLQLGHENLFFSRVQDETANADSPSNTEHTLLADENPVLDPAAVGIQPEPAASPPLAAVAVPSTATVSTADVNAVVTQLLATTLEDATFSPVDSDFATCDEGGPADGNPPSRETGIVDPSATGPPPIQDALMQHTPTLNPAKAFSPRAARASRRAATAVTVQSLKAKLAMPPTDADVSNIPTGGFEEEKSPETTERLRGLASASEPPDLSHSAPVDYTPDAFPAEPPNAPHPVSVLHNPASPVHLASPFPPRSRAADLELQFGSLPATAIDSRDLVLRAAGDHPMADAPAAGTQKTVTMTDEERDDLLNESNFQIGVFHDKSLLLLQEIQARNAAFADQLAADAAQNKIAQANLASHAAQQTKIMADLSAKLGRHPAPAPAPALAPAPAPASPPAPVRRAPVPHATAAELHVIKQEQRNKDLARQQGEPQQQQQLQQQSQREKLEHEQREQRKHEEEHREFERCEREQREREQREREERAAQHERELHLQRQRELERRATKTRQKQASLRHMQAELARCQASIDALHASDSEDDNLAADPPSLSRDRRTVIDHHPDPDPEHSAASRAAAEVAYNERLDLATAGFNRHSQDKKDHDKRRHRDSQIATQREFRSSNKRYGHSSFSPAADELVDDSARPLSSTTARNTQVQLDSAAAADEATHRYAVGRNYVLADPKKFSRVTAYPWPVGADATLCAIQFFQSLDTALSEILERCDDSGTDLDSEHWVPGWLKPLQKLTLLALPQTGDFSDTRLFKQCFKQAQTLMDADDSGPSAYALLKRTLSSHFGVEDNGEALKALETFGVSNSVPFEMYLPRLELAISMALSIEGVHKPSAARVISIARTSIRQQFPALTLTLFPGALCTVEQPYASVTDMLKVFQTISNNLTPAINGETFFSTVAKHKASIGMPPAAGHFRQPQQTQRAQHNRGNGTRDSPLVMNVQENRDEDMEPCRREYACWPLAPDDFHEVMLISDNFSTRDPPLWNDLLNTSSRRELFRKYEGCCLNCGGQNCSVKTCRQPFTNSSGALNPALGNLGDNGRAFQSWQARLRSYRRDNVQRADRGRSNRNRSSHKRQHSQGAAQMQQNTLNSGPSSTSLVLAGTQNAQDSGTPAGNAVYQPQHN